MTLALERDVTEGIYWLNIKGTAPYGAVIAHTNFIPFTRYGEHIVYLASYFSGTVPQGLDTLMLEDFCEPVLPSGWRRSTGIKWQSIPGLVRYIQRDIVTSFPHMNTGDYLWQGCFPGLITRKGAWRDPYVQDPKLRSVS